MHVLTCPTIESSLMKGVFKHISFNKNEINKNYIMCLPCPGLCPLHFFLGNLIVRMSQICTDVYSYQITCTLHNVLQIYDDISTAHSHLMWTVVGYHQSSVSTTSNRSPLKDTLIIIYKFVINIR